MNDKEKRVLAVGLVLLGGLIGSARGKGVTVRNLIPGDSCFEVINSFSAGEIDPGEAAVGGRSLQWNMAGAGRGWIRHAPLPVQPGKTYTFSLYAKAERDGVKARLIAANPRWRHTTFGPTVVLDKEWNRCSFTFKAKQPSYWLGIHENKD